MLEILTSILQSPISNFQSRISTSFQNVDRRARCDNGVRRIRRAARYRPLPLSPGDPDGITESPHAVIG